MPDQTIPSGTDPLSGALARSDWRAGSSLTASDLCLGQRYSLQRLRRHRRIVHGWGVVCGLNVVAAGNGWELIICPGYGITPCGDEIDLGCRYRFDLREFLWTRPLDVTTRKAWIAVEANEEPNAFESAPPIECGCGCSDASEKPSRVIDGVRVVVSWTRLSFNQPAFDLCSGGTPQCPPCPETCGLPLAVVSLPALDNQRLLNSAVDNSVFRTQA